MTTTERPFIQLGGPDLLRLLEEATNLEQSRDLELAAALLQEVEIRRRVADDRKRWARDRVARLRHRIIAERNRARPWPTISAQDARRASGSPMRPDWTDEGLLSLSGYHVGHTKGVNERRRRMILNYVFLEDDLSDVSDPRYASQWGSARTPARLMKLAHCLSGFAGLAIKRNDPSYAVAIREWLNDLDYLKAQFYDNWGGFPWPDMEFPEDW